jgi:hypothetical protein
MCIGMALAHLQLLMTALILLILLGEGDKKKC